jgi:hypothetical protein
MVELDSLHSVGVRAVRPKWALGISTTLIGPKFALAAMLVVSSKFLLAMAHGGDQDVKLLIISNTPPHVE